MLTGSSLRTFSDTARGGDGTKPRTGEGRKTKRKKTMVEMRREENRLLRRGIRFGDSYVTPCK